MMGILNVTPDSFWDGGQWFETQQAIMRGHEMIAEGADIIDVGGESTRPGASEVPVEEELARVVPVVEALAGRVRISIDTTKAAVADAAVEAGASLINDVSATLWPVAARHGVGWVAMHRQGTPASMQLDPRYDDVVAEVSALLVDRAGRAADAGVDDVWIDPGIGFGKTVEHNLELLRRLDELLPLGRPIVIGTSRKSFLGRIAAGGGAASGTGGSGRGARRRRRARAPRSRRSAGRDGGLQRAGLRARRERLPGARGRAGPRGACGCGCYVEQAMAREPHGDDSEELDDDGQDPDEDREGTVESVTVEISGLSLYTHHGVSEAEREVGQRLVLDLRLDVGETDATVTDSIEDTVDYGEVCQLVALIAQQRSHKTLERLCSTIADRLLADYDLEAVWVKAAKPEPPIALTVEEVSVEVWREAEG